MIVSKPPMAIKLEKIAIRMTPLIMYLYALLMVGQSTDLTRENRDFFPGGTTTMLGFILPSESYVDVCCASVAAEVRLSFPGDRIQVIRLHNMITFEGITFTFLIIGNRTLKSIFFNKITCE